MHFFFTVLNALIQRWSIIAPAHLHDLLFAAPACRWCCSAGVIVFSLLNIPFIRKLPMIVLTSWDGAAATWFMYTYGTVIDQNMIVNVFETNSRSDCPGDAADDPVAGRCGSGSIDYFSPDAHSHPENGGMPS